jgi:hypothetical protein
MGGHRSLVSFLAHLALRLEIETGRSMLGAAARHAGGPGAFGHIGDFARVLRLSVISSENRSPLFLKMLEWPSFRSPLGSAPERPQR